MTGGERWDIATDQHYGALRACGERAAHPNTQIALTLSGHVDAAAPVSGMPARLVRGHRDVQPPAPVAGQSAQQEGEHEALEAKRCEIADVLRQTAFAAPQVGCSDKQNQVAAHHS